MTGTFSPDGGTFTGNAKRLWVTIHAPDFNTASSTSTFWGTRRGCLPFQVASVTEDILKDMESSEGAYEETDIGLARRLYEIAEDRMAKFRARWAVIYMDTTDIARTKAWTRQDKGMDNMDITPTQQCQPLLLRVYISIVFETSSPTS